MLTTRSSCWFQPTTWQSSSGKRGTWLRTLFKGQVAPKLKYFLTERLKKTPKNVSYRSMAPFKIRSMHRVSYLSRSSASRMAGRYCKAANPLIKIWFNNSKIQSHFIMKTKSSQMKWTSRIIKMDKTLSVLMWKRLPKTFFRQWFLRKSVFFRLPSSIMRQFRQTSSSNKMIRANNKVWSRGNRNKKRRRKLRKFRWKRA